MHRYESSSFVMVMVIVIVVSILTLGLGPGLDRDGAFAAPSVLGRIVGVVMDQDGAVLPGVTVTVVDDEHGFRRVVVSDSRGTFVVAGLRMGHYTVTAELAGFGTFRAERVEVGSEETTQMPIVLRFASVSESVTVTGEYGPGHRRMKLQRGTPVPAARPLMLSGASPYVYDPLADIRPARSGFNTEAYDQLTDNPFRSVSREPLSTFSIDVDTASYSNVRRFLQRYQQPPKDAVRIEELINYFDYDYESPRPDAEAPFSAKLERMVCPWQPEHELVRIALKGAEMTSDERPPSNLVFLVDVSGSMGEPNKLPLVVASMKMLARRLRPVDTVAIVVYAGASGVVLPPTPGNERGAVLAALDRLSAGGSTNGGQGIRLAYDLAAQSLVEGGVNRVVLATDGDFNVGVTGRSELVELVRSGAEKHIFLTVLGFGMGNLKDGALEQLADQGNGNYAYIDSLRESKKVLVDQMNQTLVTIAKDVKIQVELNPARVNAYRLLGYENRVLEHEDFNDDTKDAGEIGAGHSVTALYEIVPAGVAIELPSVDPLKYQTPGAPSDGAASDELLTVKVRYKEPEGAKSRLLSYALSAKGRQAPTEDFRFAAAVAGFGMLLRESPYRGELGWEQVKELAKSSLGEDEQGYRRELVELVELAALVFEGDP